MNEQRYQVSEQASKQTYVIVMRERRMSEKKNQITIKTEIQERSVDKKSTLKKCCICVIYQFSSFEMRVNGEHKKQKLNQKVESIILS